MTDRILQSRKFTFPLTKVTKEEPFIRIGLISDSHFALKESEGEKFYRDSLKKMQEAVSYFNKATVNFSVHLGDVKDVNKELDRAETFDYLEKIKTVFNDLDQPIHYCLGNHDIDINYKQEFLRSLSNNKADPLKSYYSFESGGILFVILDTNFDQKGKDISYLNYKDWQASYIDTQQLEWLDNLLENNSLPTIVFCHHPLYPCVFDEKKYHLVNYKELRKVIDDHQKVQVVLTGHAHRFLHQYLENCHHICVPPMVEHPFARSNSFSIAELNPEQLILENYYGN